MKYTKLSTIPDEFDETTEINKKYAKPDSGTIAVRNDVFALSKPPQQYRDTLFGLVFIVQMLIVIAISAAEKENIQKVIFGYRKFYTWPSLVMSVTLLGCFFGLAMSSSIFVIDSRELIFSIGIFSSVILKFCIGNILLIMRSVFSTFGILVLFSAIIDLFLYKTALGNVSFSSAAVQMVVDCFKFYGFWFYLTFVIIVLLHTASLLWWGIFFMSLISPEHTSLWAIFVLTLATLFCAFWLTQFFHALVGFVVGGCVLWIFVKEENENFNGTNRLLLYLRCALTTSFGSLCKAALFVSPLQSVLRIHHRVHDTTSTTYCSLKRLFSLVLKPVLGVASIYNRLVFPLLAVYGRTFRVTSEDLLLRHAETLDVLVEDSTYFTLQCISVALSGLIAIIAALVALPMEKTLWPLYFFMFFYLAYCSISLSIHVYSSAVDALIVASALNPIRFAKINQTVFLRFLRTSESALH